MTRLASAIIVVALVTVPVRTTPSRAAGQSDPAAGPANWAGDLSPITPSDWSYNRAAHLIERAGFGAAPDEIARLAALTPQQAIDELVD